MEIFLGIIVGAISMYWGISFFNKKSGVQKIEHQSVVLIEKIKSVCKLISVEGDFAEIYHYQDTKNQFFGFLTGKKRAILLVNAKAHIGFDLSKIEMNANTSKKEIIITYFPEPQVLTVETDVRYYDKSEGFFNKFNAEDLTELNKEAKKFIVDKIPDSGLLNSASKEALDTILMIEKMIETSGWKLNYSQLVLPEVKTKKIEEIQK
ncbi:DUF4230 domain-containing protein [Lutibacter sp. TH_r2]|uniref:DUF4230 domain-containing protein n=1 Tax=Lutibacter sp. TH_r2 TaxID=3082083 RepID=UPI002953C72E|nr:DUF4230 domain-containing protein [Lutibacter sp. TH_r2]MDV7187691.1 DUF4230 domain-containing protein [Lutibacter sp. TH_r2]